VNPARDLDIIHSELRFKDTEYLNKQMDDLEKSEFQGNINLFKVNFESLVKYILKVKRKGMCIIYTCAIDTTNYGMPTLASTKISSHKNFT
jgi:ribosome-binding ATPase YchF (GTP1/OBG family)